MIFKNVNKYAFWQAYRQENIFGKTPLIFRRQKVFHSALAKKFCSRLRTSNKNAAARRILQRRFSFNWTVKSA